MEMPVAADAHAAANVVAAAYLHTTLILRSFIKVTKTTSFY